MHSIDETVLHEFKGLGRKYEKALQLLQSGSVKRHLFQPSRREIWTVIGRQGDQFVDDTLPYCSCSHFHYKVLDGKNTTCYHLLAVQMARKLHLYDEIVMHDVEHLDFLKHLLGDLARLGE